MAGNMKNSSDDLIIEKLVSVDSIMKLFELIAPRITRDKLYWYWQKKHSKEYGELITHLYKTKKILDRLMGE